jgi:predicted amidohydrolase YtcJ
MARMLPGLVLSFVALVSFAEPPSLILVNGRVFTADPAKPQAEAVAITGSTITAVGSTGQVQRLAGEKTRVIDVQGRVVIPGINDAHTHPGMATPFFGVAPDLSATLADVRSALASAVDETPADLWIIATVGPAIINDTTITRATLDQLAPGRKILINAFTGHGAVLSSAGLAALNITSDIRNPPGGWYERDAAGQLNGRVAEYAHFDVDRRLADLATDEELEAHITAFSDEALSFGITTVQAMPFPSAARFDDAVRKAKPGVRVRHIAFPLSTEKPPKFLPGAALKFILDGTPIERGAALREFRYADGSQGRENFRDLAPLVKMAVDGKVQLLLHASGDKTVESALKAIAKTSLKRTRLEHADGLHPDLFPLAKKTGVIAVVNPSHFPFSNFYPQGATYMPAQSLLKAGIPIALGSDGPINPYLNLMFAAHRTDAESESLSREDAILAYTTGSAFAENQETKKGKLAAGMLADVAVLSQDIFSVPPPALPETRSVLTIVGGKIVFQQ